MSARREHARWVGRSPRLWPAQLARFQFLLTDSLPLCWVIRCVLLAQFRQPGEIDCHLPRLVHREEAGVSCNVWVGSTVEDAELLPSGVLDGESARDLISCTSGRALIDSGVGRKTCY